MKIHRLIKIIASVCFVLITVALVVVWNSPATGYEVCIYAATSPIFWGALISGFVCGIGIIVQQLYARDHEKSNLWVVGLIVILVSYTTLLCLWIIRGYALWSSGDPLSHLGWIQDVIYRGHIEAGNFYPIAHIYLAQTSQLLDINAIVLHRLIPLFFALLYVAGMHLLAKSILPSKGAVILATIVSLIPLHDYYLNLTPNHLLSLALPLAFFLLIKSFTPGTVQWKIMFTIMVFLFPIFHPIHGFILLLVLLTIWLPGRTLGILRKERLKATGSAFGFNITAALFLFVWSIAWISEFGVWDATIRNVHTVITEGGPVHLDILAEQILLAEGYGFNVTEHFFRVFGGIVVLILLTMAALPILWRKVSAEANLRNLFSLYAPLAALALAIIVFHFFHIAFGPFRLLVYVVIICTIFAGFMLYGILERARSWQKSNYVRRLAPLLVTIVLIAVAINGGLKLHPSPYILAANFQITRTEIAGMDWFFHNKDVAMPITGMTISPGRFADFILPAEQRKQHGHIPAHMPREAQVPWHFGYDEHLQLGETFADDTYMVLTALDRVVYVEVLPEIQHLRLSPSEFEKLEQDPSVKKLYGNGGLDVYLIRARAPPT
ncbi:hypothetical protein M1N79_01625 [Dehalococcoidia bacterium]|nr:hypothetical protein [Dehalococcoidia bacterium]